MRTMAFNRLSAILALIFAIGIAVGGEENGKWDRDAGKPAPRLVAASWIGNPVSLEAVKGNTVVLAFWNADVPWC
jgi:hypothetical protein